MRQGILDDVRTHDAALARSEIEIWIGSEPTFSKPLSLQPCWLTEAEGSEKEIHARALLLALAPRLAGDVRVLRVQGRQYPGEASARWCLGALFARRGAPSGVQPQTLALDTSELSPTPVVGDGQAWLTVTPDPGVVEVNMAPAHDLVTFAHWSEAVYAAATEAGLSATRFRFNGDVCDSGGGGQITLGGPSPMQSPFLVHPQLLPGLVRYLNHHPALSYVFAPPFCGSASQGPRADESVRERFDELPVALDYLAARGDLASPAELWGMLAPLLVDASGCSHRSELNIEKLWNPWFRERGQLGLVELRSLRMPATPARLTAIAALFRAIAARLASVPYLDPIVDWGPRLHDTFGLPWNLERDLEIVLADLDAHGFGLGPSLRAELLAQAEPVASIALDEASLEVRAAVSFWPLVEDVAMQGQRGARLVDSSATRLQLLVRVPQGTPFGQIAANGWQVPLEAVPGEASRAHALGSVLYRAFMPATGLHPEIPAHDPLVIDWVRCGQGASVRLHAWKPSGGSYAGLPENEDQARQRRSERVVVARQIACEMRASISTGSLLDLRRQYPVRPTLTPPPVSAPAGFLKARDRDPASTR